MKKLKFTISGNPYEVEITREDQNTIELEVNGTSYTVEVEREIKVTKTPTLVRSAVPEPTIKERKIQKTISKGTTKVHSPLPGVILHVHVKPGDTVKTGQILLVLEAMKMETNIEAEKDGVVETVKVKPGDNVLQNDVLVEIN